MLSSHTRLVATVLDSTESPVGQLWSGLILSHPVLVAMGARRMQREEERILFPRCLQAGERDDTPPGVS